jgi:hypothetical protein
MRSMCTCRKRAGGGAKSPNGVTVWRRLWSAGMTGKHMPKCGNPFARLATQNALQPVSPLLLWLDATDRGRTGTLGAVVELERMAEVSRQRYRTRRTPWYRGLVVSRAAGRWLTPGVFGARRRCPAMRSVRRGWQRSDGLDAREGVRDDVLSRGRISVVNCATKSKWLNFRGEHLSRF